MEMVNSDHVISVPEFYRGKNIFITGATGFLGKILLEKLLRSCPDIGNIYILVRPKKGKELNERVEHMLKDDLFNTLKQNFSSQISKIFPIYGDCCQLNLGLSADDYQKIISSVSVIYHVAASIRFDDTLQYAILLNTRGTRELAQLALQTRNLSVLVHVSTTYCNCVVGREILEKIYPAPADWRKLIKIAEDLDKSQLTALTDKFLGPYPNTYLFTKALGEHVVKDLCEGKIPTVICRPSIVINSLREPIEGWIDNFNGPIGLLVACGKGLLRNCYQDPSLSGDYIPVDVVVKAIVVATWDLGLRQQRDHIELVHCSTGYHKWFSQGTLVSLTRDMSYDIPFNNSIWVPKGYVTRCSVYAYLCTILFHLLPACFLDIGLKLAGRKPMVLQLQKKIYNASLQLRYFTFQEWDFCNENFISLADKIMADDKENWHYDSRNVDITKFIRNCMVGARRYLLHEPDETLEKARAHYKRQSKGYHYLIIFMYVEVMAHTVQIYHHYRDLSKQQSGTPSNGMYWLDKVTMFLLYGSLLWMVIYFGLIEKTINKVYNYLNYYVDSDYA